MRKKRIFFLITRSEPGGAQSHVLELIQGLKKNYEIILATGEQGFLLDEASSLGVESHLIPSLNRKISPTQDLKAYKEIINLLLQSQPDLVHTHSSKAGILGRLAAYRLGIKNVFTAHGWAFAEGTPWVSKIIGVPTEFIAAKWCDKIIAVSHADKKLAVKLHIAKDKKIAVIHNGIADIEQGMMKRHIEVNDIPILTAVARLAPQKNFICLLDALVLIDEKYILRIVGDGPDLDLVKSHAKKLGLESKIKFMGTRADVPAILASSDIFVLSSDWEGYPISIIEAMRSGLPIISTNVGGISEAVIDNENGYLVPRGNAEKLSQSIRKLLTNKEKRIEMGRCSRKFFEQQGSTEIMLEKVKGVYESLL